MWLLTLLPLLLAVGAASLAWHRASQFDRRPNDHRPGETGGLTLAALLAAVAATTMVQLALLSTLVPG
jgi:hypothetical protein